MFAKENTEEISMTKRNDYLTQRLEKNAIRTKVFLKSWTKNSGLLMFIPRGLPGAFVRFWPTL